MENEEQNTFDLIKMIPNALTMSALCMGLFAIRMAMIGSYEIACLYILIASILDTLDGRVARKLNASSDFGAQLDSLADLVNFGIAPGFIVYFWKMQEYSTIKSIGWIPVLILATCMATRLARFNVNLVAKDQENPLNKYFFQGIPAPMASMLVLFPVFATFELNISFLQEPLFVIINTIVFALLAASTIPTPCVKKVKIASQYRHLVLLIFSTSIIFLLFRRWETLAILSLLYLISIVIGWFYYIKFKRAGN